MSKKIKGLTAKEVEGSRAAHGSNRLTRERTKGIFRRFLENLSDPIIKILLIALALEVLFTFGNCNLIEVFGIVAAILIATTVSTVSEYGSERAFAKIEEQTREQSARVLRDGIVIEISPDELVVGDIVYLGSGEGIYADGTLIDGVLSVDQSALNGENLEARKTPGTASGWDLFEPSRLFRGSVITEGEGVMRVERVGGETFFGMVATDVQEQTRISPLKLRLSGLASQISKLGYIVAALVGFIYLFNTHVAANNFEIGAIMSSLRDTKHLFSTLIHALTMMITVVVVAVPEGLPMMITVVLSANMKRMIKDNVLVKKLVGIETAGSLNILFTDKTGTLTTGRLSVDRIIIGDDVLKSLGALKGHGAIYSTMALSAYYNTDTVISDGGVVGGNATDRAIAEYFGPAARPHGELMAKQPFSSDIKYSSVTLKDGTTLYKGAPEVLLSGCRLALCKDGVARVSDLYYVKRLYSEALSRGERVIAVTKRECGADEMCFVALIVLKDKLRSGVRRAVGSIQGAGIQIVMLTGDSRDTAVSIAEECGFFKRSAGHIALVSEDMRTMSDEELMAVLPRLRVVARALPRDKSRLVALSQRMELVVGMTGDGVNDAPSLKLADVGFAMGSGTDIAKSAGDIVILDNSIDAIAKTILYGRTIFKSIRKFITFQLIMNFAACGITLIGPFIGVDNPITIIQMLWVNIIMDTLGGLAFAGEPPLDYYMKEKPKRRDEPILSRDVIGQILVNGAYTLGLMVCFLRMDLFRELFGEAQLSAFYALFIFAGLFNCLSSRCERFFVFSNIHKNRLFIVILMFISCIQLLIIYFGGSLFRSMPLGGSELGTVLGLAFTVLVFDSLRRIARKLTVVN